MTDKIFIDTNILVYLSSTEEQKKEIAKKLIYSHQNASISTQVLSEFSNVVYRKKIFSSEKLLEFIEIFSKIFKIEIITPITVINAIKIKEKYQLSLWDSMIVSTALENNCNILISEDMQHNQIIENKLKIINPFKG
ncbi:MAG: PIN domain-containing protein [Bacteroidales bacterium]|nr:PIN domain-containing protein [Bacteroidales bacterium]